MSEQPTPTAEQPTPTPIARIDTPVDRRRVGDIEVTKFAGLTFREYREAIEFCKLIAQSKNGIPPFLKNNAPDCLVVTTQALRWNLEPVWVMQHSYVARTEALISYDSAVFAAIILASGVLKGRPRYEYAGEGEERTCTVIATFLGESEPHEYTTPPIKQCRPRRNADGTVKGSPLWERDPDQQLGYFAIRNWGRRHVPEVLGGVYDRDEFEDTTQNITPAGPASPNLMERLPGRIEGAGFGADIDGAIGEEKPEKRSKAGKKAATKAAAEAADELFAGEGDQDRPADENSTGQAP